MLLFTHAKKRHAVNNNTLRDAQKLQKNAVSRRETRDFRVKCARKHLAKYNL